MSELGGGWSGDSHRLIWVEGGDAVEFLDGQLSQDIAGLHTGAVARSLLLEPRGKMRVVLWVLRGEDRVGLLTPAGTEATVEAELNRFRFRVDARISVDPRTLWGFYGGLPAETPSWSEGPPLAVALPSTAPSRLTDADPGEALEEGRATLHRIRAGEPIMGVDIDESTIPQETGLVPEAVSFTKGCYLGQELVARIDSRGHVNRILRRVVVRGPAATGMAALTGSEEVGTLASVAVNGAETEALALLRREVEPGAAVEVNKHEAFVFAL